MKYLLILLLITCLSSCKVSKYKQEKPLPQYPHRGYHNMTLTPDCIPLADINQ